MKLGFVGLYAGVSKRFTTAFSASALIRSELVFSTDLDEASVSCGFACREEPACAGFFTYVVSSTTIQCRLLSDTGEDQGTDTALVSSSYVNVGLVTTTTSTTTNVPALLSYDLVFDGAQDTRRFSTAFDAGALISQTLDLSVEECAGLCNDDASCAGFFWYSSDTGKRLFHVPEPSRLACFEPLLISFKSCLYIFSLVLLSACVCACVRVCVRVCVCVISSQVRLAAVC